MTPVIRISDTTFKRLQQFAVPLQDTVDDVVRRALDALETQSSSHDWAASGIAPAKNVGDDMADRAPGIMPKLPQKEFREPLLEYLKSKGGGEEVRTIREEIYPTLQSRLLEGDFATVSTGEARWWNAICWERNDLVKEGILRPDSRRGYWELSGAGRKLVGLPRKVTWI